MNSTPQSQVEKDLADAQYALNRAMTAIDNAALAGTPYPIPDLQRENLTIARDLVWGVRQALDPDLDG